MKQYHEACDDIHDRPTDPTGETLALEAEAEHWTEARSGVRPRPHLPLQRAPWIEWRAFAAGELVIGLLASAGLFCFGNRVTAGVMLILAAFCVGSLTSSGRK